MTQFDNNSLATLEFALNWNDGNRQFADRIIARRVNAWRDIFPPGFLENLKGKHRGESARENYAPGMLVPPHDPDLVKEIPMRNCLGRLRDGTKVVPKLGRFYPLGMFSGLSGVYPSTMTPCRVVAMSDNVLTIDCNHPLARKPLELTATIQAIQDKGSDTGGLLFNWAEEACHNGPGMQARLSGTATDFITGDFLTRPDDDDTAFYAFPRPVAHIDATASNNLTAMYSRFLKPGMKVLDLMSSVHSHLPDGLDLNTVGLGMNQEELNRNPKLDERIVHDLNRDPAIPLKGPFDAIIISLSIEYLTNPLAVLQSARSLVAPEGVILIGISNRWFPTKAVKGWTELHEFERTGFVLQLLEEAGFTGPAGADSIRNDWRPQSDRHFLQTRGVSDPVFMIWARP